MSILMFLAEGFTIGNFLSGIAKSLGNYGQIITTIAGLAMVIVGVYQVAKNLISHGKGQTNWLITAALIVVGGALAVTGGWGLVGNIASAGQGTMSDLGTGTGDTTGDKTYDPWKSPSGDSGD